MRERDFHFLLYLSRIASTNELRGDSIQLGLILGDIEDLSGSCRERRGKTSHICRLMVIKNQRCDIETTHASVIEDRIFQLWIFQTDSTYRFSIVPADSDHQVVTTARHQTKSVDAISQSSICHELANIGGEELVLCDRSPQRHTRRIVIGTITRST